MGRITEEKTAEDKFTEDWSRYQRQMLIRDFGKEGQRRLRRAKVLLVGAGGLGSPVALYLAGAGIGQLGIIDADEVSLSNLHRQVLHPTGNLGKNKAESAAERLSELNDQVKVVTYPFFLTEENAEKIIACYDFVVMAVDNFETRFLINDICVRLRKPFCHGGIVALDGQVMTYLPGQGPCYRCIFEEVPEEGSVPTAATVGVLGPAVGVIGSIQALEVIKYFTGIGELLTGKMFLFDGLTMKSRIIRMPHPVTNCRACGKQL